MKMQCVDYDVMVLDIGLCLDQFRRQVLRSESCLSLWGHGLC